MSKIAIIRCGSIIFCQTFLNDIFATPALNGSEIALMGPTLSKLEKMEGYAQKIIDKNGLKTSVYSSRTDRREALKDAKYIILSFQIGGLEAFKADYEIPYKYGVDQCIGDSLGPGGVFRLLRSAPVLIDIGKDVMELCPGAYVLNYVNPMGGVCTTMLRNKIKLCWTLPWCSNYLGSHCRLYK